MTVVLKSNMNIKRIIINLIEKYLTMYQMQLNISTFHFEPFKEGYLTYIISPLTLNSGTWLTSTQDDISELSGESLLRVLKSLKKRSIYGLIRTDNGQMIKIKPKKN